MLGARQRHLLALQSACATLHCKASTTRGMVICSVSLAKKLWRRGCSWKLLGEPYAP